jgi:hypothetical protein
LGELGFKEPGNSSSSIPQQQQQQQQQQHQPGSRLSCK